MVYFTLCIFYFKQASKTMFLPKRNKQAGSYQGRSSQENGTLLADDDVFISHCRHVSSSCCAGAHDHCYLESKHTGNSCRTARTVNYTVSGSTVPQTVPGHVTSLSLCCLCFSLFQSLSSNFNTHYGEAVHYAGASPTCTSSQLPGDGVPPVHGAQSMEQLRRA